MKDMAPTATIWMKKNVHIEEKAPHTKCKHIVLKWYLETWKGLKVINFWKWTTEELFAGQRKIKADSAFEAFVEVLLFCELES